MCPCGAKALGHVFNAPRLSHATLVIKATRPTTVEQRRSKWTRNPVLVYSVHLGRMQRLTEADCFWSFKDSTTLTLQTQRMKRETRGFRTSRLGEEHQQLRGIDEYVDRAYTPNSRKMKVVRRIHGWSLRTRHSKTAKVPPMLESFGCWDKKIRTPRLVLDHGAEDTNS